MELWEVYDKDRQKKGRTMVRGGEIAADDYHLVVHIGLFNSKGQMLIQQRQPFKPGWSNLWDVTVGGSALVGETSTRAAERELYEEIGFKWDFSHERPFITVNFSFGFDDFYLIEAEVDLKSLVLQVEEVQSVKWANLDEILQMIDLGTFIPYHKTLIATLFDMRSHRGAILMST